MGLVLLLFPEVRNALVWLAGGVVVVILFLAPLIGYFVQPWSPWWVTGAPLNPPGVVPVIPPPQGPLPGENSALLRALQPWLGVPYLFGGNDHRGIDCSGLVVQVARAMGWSMPWRTAQAQYGWTSRVSEPEPGDLVFFRATYNSPDFITHVGWYIGSGWMISAIEPAVGRQSLGEPFWRSHFVGYGRIPRPRQ